VTRRRSQARCGRSRGHPPPPARLACGSVPCHGARAAIVPYQPDGAACSPWSTTSASPDSLLQAHKLRVCLACHELSAVGSRCPGPRCSSAMLAALAAWNPAPPAQTLSPLSGPPPPQGLDIPNLLARQIPTLRRVPTHCGLLLLRPCPDLPAAGGETRADLGGPGPPSPLPQHCAGRPGPRREGQTILLHAKMPPQLPIVGPRPLGGIVAGVKRATPADGPRWLSRTRAAASEAPGCLVPGFGPNSGGRPGPHGRRGTW